MRILLTRPLEDSQRTAQELARRGHQALIAPLFEITYLDGPELPLDNVQAILATSGNGVRAFARRALQREIPLFAVGTHTAAAAKQEGFHDIYNAEGDAAALAAVVRARLSAQSGALFHAAGTNASPAFSAALAQEGFEFRTSVLYDIVEAPELPDAAAEALRANTLDAVLVYSPRSARLFADCVKRAGLALSCQRLLFCSISREAAGPLRDLPLAELCIAERPDQASLLDLLPSALRAAESGG